MFEFAQNADGAGVYSENHYKLVPPEDVTDEDLLAYREKAEARLFTELIFSSLAHSGQAIRREPPGCLDWSGAARRHYLPSACVLLMKAATRSWSCLRLSSRT